MNLATWPYEASIRGMNPSDCSQWACTVGWSARHWSRRIAVANGQSVRPRSGDSGCGHTVGARADAVGLLLHPYWDAVTGRSVIAACCSVAFAQVMFVVTWFAPPLANVNLFFDMCASVNRPMGSNGLLILIGWFSIPVRDWTITSVVLLLCCYVRALWITYGHNRSPLL